MKNYSELGAASSFVFMVQVIVFFGAGVLFGADFLTSFIATAIAAFITALIVLWLFSADFAWVAMIATIAAGSAAIASIGNNWEMALVAAALTTYAVVGIAEETRGSFVKNFFCALPFGVALVAVSLLVVLPNKEEEV